MSAVSVDSLRITDQWGDALTVATRDDVLEVQTSRGKTVVLDHGAVARLRSWLLAHHPPRPADDQ